MVIVRIAFFVFLLFILLPSNTYEKAELHRKVERIGHDVTTFCDRNSQVCDKTSGFFETLYSKMATTVEMLEDLLRGEDRGSVPSEQKPQLGQRQRQGYRYDANRYPTAAMATYSQDTLTSSDLRPAWNGPKPWPSQVSYNGKSQ